MGFWMDFYRQKMEPCPLQGSTGKKGKENACPKESEERRGGHVVSRDQTSLSQLEADKFGEEEGPFDLSELPRAERKICRRRERFWVKSSGLYGYSRWSQEVSNM